MRWPSPCCLIACAVSSGLGTPWPTDDPGLSRAQRKELQELLIQRGYDIGQADGLIGDLHAQGDPAGAEQAGPDAGRWACRAKDSEGAEGRLIDPFGLK